MAALAAPRPKQEQRAPKMFDDTLSSDSKSSEYTKTHLTVKLKKQLIYLRDLHPTLQNASMPFPLKEKELAIGCDTPYCRRWFHQGYIDINVSGMSDEQIVQTEFICKFC